MRVAPCWRLESLSSKYCCCSLYFLSFSACFFLRPRCNNTYSSTVSDAHAASPLSVLVYKKVVSSTRAGGVGGMFGLR